MCAFLSALEYAAMIFLGFVFISCIALSAERRREREGRRRESEREGERERERRERKERRKGKAKILSLYIHVLTLLTHHAVAQCSIVDVQPQTVDTCVLPYKEFHQHYSPAYDQSHCAATPNNNYNNKI